MKLMQLRATQGGQIKKGVWAVLLALSPQFALAQNFVPPPTPPGVQSPASQVTPPSQVNSYVPAPAPAPTAPALGQVLPDAPRQPAPTGPVYEPPRAQTPAATPVAAPPAGFALPSVPASSMPAAPAPSATAPSLSRSNKVQEAAFAGLALTPVSDSQLNRFVFPEPIEGIYFSEGAPLPECPANAGPQDPCKPVFLNGKKVMLLQFRAGAKGPVQMLVHLHSGRILTMNLAPAPGPGAVVRVDGAQDGASDARLRAGDRSILGAGKNPEERYIELLRDIASGQLPPGFEPEAIGAAVRFEYFDVVPMAAWGNGDGLRAHLFQVRAHGNQPVAINASLFRTQNILSVALDRETITYDQPALLYVLEQLPERF